MAEINSYVSNSGTFAHFSAKAEKGDFSELKVYITDSSHPPHDESLVFDHTGTMTHQDYNQLLTAMRKNRADNLYNRVAMALDPLAHPR